MRVNIVCIALLALVFRATSSVIGIDFGSQYLKAVAIKPGMPFFTVVDEATKRKSLSLVKEVQTLIVSAVELS
jgi:molecular chaperone DnaK (HSP70)